MRFPEKFEVNFEVDDDLDPQTVLIPSLILQPIVENSIKHGFNNINYRGVIKIEVDQVDNNFISIKVRDNGNGSKTKSRNVNGKILKHKSFGIDLVKTRLELLNKAEFAGNATFEESVSKSGYETRIRIPLTIA